MLIMLMGHGVLGVCIVFAEVWILSLVETVCRLVLYRGGVCLYDAHCLLIHPHLVFVC